jgi:(4-O-methyl)-D-glucuronate---lignin esterase
MDRLVCSVRAALGLGFGLLASLCSAGTFDVRPDRVSGVYRAGETITWTVAWQDDDGAAVPETATYSFRAGGATEISAGSLAFTGGRATLESKLEEPDTLLLEVAWAEDGETRRAVGGAVASPGRIRPAAPPPDDFDAFWAAKIAELGKVPANPRLTAAESEHPGVDYWQITLDNIRGTRIHGQLARPSAGDDLPALLIVQWAGVYGLQKPWVVDRAAEGWLALDILPHDLPIDRSEEFYADQRAGALRNYWAIGNDDRETSYFLRMYLSCYRAVEYLKSRPDWNGRTLVVMGTSQGGQQTLVTAGLHPDVTAALALVPSGSDMLAPTAGRAAAFPDWYHQTDGEAEAAVREASRYFDVANFAARIEAPVLLGVGLRDRVCPPATVLAASNQIRSYQELIILPESGHQNVEGSQDPYADRAYGGWLPALRRGLAAPVKLTEESAHRLLLDELGIDSLRPGANPNDPSAPNAVNYDEAKANPYPGLPDPLVADDGSTVTTPSGWRDRRRPEIVEHFEREIYGRVPANAPAVTWEILGTARETRGGVQVVTKRLAGHLDNFPYPLLDVSIELTFSTPADAKGPVPTVLHFGFPPSLLSLFPRPPGPGWDEQVLAHGWGVATIVPTSYQADDGVGLTRGVIGLANRGQPRGLEDWGALRAWAWGASRALDYFESDGAVDAERVAIEGLSRYGKAALVAMAFDERFAVGFIGSSGAGGAKLLRRNFGERVENLGGAGAYHWMAGNYLKYAGPLGWDDLPVDAHELIALCAPRPVFVSAGSPDVEGRWIDQRGMFMATAAAGPVYELLGRRGLGTDEYPAEGVTLDGGQLAWRQHSGGHTTLPNWPAFLRWADRRIDNPAAGRWVGTWATAQQLTEPRNLPPQPGFAAATVRQKLLTSIGGNAVRVRFSNVFGNAPLTIDGAAIAVAGGDSAIDPDTSRTLNFRGKPSVTIQPGVEWISDTVDMRLPPMAHLAVTTRTTSAPSDVTGHPGSRTTSYFDYAGAPLDAPELAGATTVDHWYFVSGIDVRTTAADAAAVAILGDSITDGRGSTTNGNDRWPDQLSRRLRNQPGTAEVAVLNQGIGGNRVLRDGLGPSMLGRLDRDVLARPGVRWLVILEGINDLGTAAGARASGEPAATAADLIAAFDQVITRAHDRGVEVYGATIMPYGDCFYYSEQGEGDRRTINEWIRHSGRFDAVIDFDAAARDPSRPDRLRADVDSGDHLHLSAAGLEHIANAIDLSLFER